MSFAVSGQANPLLRVRIRKASGFFENPEERQGNSGSPMEVKSFERLDEGAYHQSRRCPCGQRISNNRGRNE